MTAQNTTTMTTRRRLRPGRMIERIAEVAALIRTRHALAQLDAHLLEDVGLTEEDVREELARPLWQAPAHWRR